jgi:threo-3-hydroxy-L-aspartate ammonia-lyase
VIELADVQAAAERLRGVANVTPVLTSRTLDAEAGATVLLKAETFQRAGAFKFRGAYNRIACLTEDERQRGVAAFSSGNHAQAVALAASLVGTHALILMPQDAPAEKVAATRGYGAEVVTYDRYSGDREALGAAMAEERGLVLVPPYEDPLVMAGQGTTGLELLHQAGTLDVLVAPVGGGGLIGGSGTAAKGLHPGIRVVGVEPSEGDDTRRSLQAGERVRIPVPRTIADGLQADIPGALTFSVNQRVVDEIVTVDDGEIVAAMAFLFERMKVVVEPSGAVGVAAVMFGKLDVTARRVGVILSGGNVGVERFRQLLGP